MIRLIAIIIFFLLSLLTVCNAPTNLLWYVSILATEFCWVFFLITLALLFLPNKHKRFTPIVSIAGIVTLIFFSLPVVQAYRLSAKIKQEVKTNPLFTNQAIPTNPFSFSQMLAGYLKKQITYKTFTYNVSQTLTLDFYATTATVKRPCVIVVHGGSWAGGDNKQLPELNSELAKAGYHVASINYRLAPKHLFPAPIQDLSSAIRYLKANADKLSIDSNRFVLLGRSAGGQIVLSAADLLHDASIKGVISFYGPADMVWGFANPTNPLVLNSRKVMADYLGGPYNKVPNQYISSSATTTATSFTPATLLIHGKNDPLVSYQHSERLSAKLDNVHASHYELYLPWATHGFDWTLNGPAGQLSTWTVLRFLESVVATR